ncbi:MAG: hypothetical protein JO307_14480 [Bryobacterales bacterium]|nr:hypothetical protein [Bryobacterales bacterium]
MQQIHSAAAGREMLDTLARRFRVVPVKLSWQEIEPERDTLLGYYFPEVPAIAVYTAAILKQQAKHRDDRAATITSVLCHEFAHHVCWYLFRSYLRKDQDQHNLTFFTLLADVVEFWYGSTQRYPWPWQYPKSGLAIPFILKRPRPPRHSRHSCFDRAHRHVNCETLRIRV